MSVSAQTDSLKVSPGAFAQTTKLYELLEKSPVRQDPKITDLLVRHSQINQRKKGIDGFRLEIFFSSDFKAREQATRVRNDFNLAFPEIPAYISFHSPNFKVRIGDFRNKSEALKAKSEIDWKYPNAFIVKDMIRFPELYTERIEQPEEQ
jgi:hypothetical protein